MTDRLPPPNRLSGVPLDRAAARRTDPAWVAAAAAHPATRVVPVCAGRVPVAGEGTPAARAAAPTVEVLGTLLGPLDPAADPAGPARVLLGVDDAGVAHFAAEAPDALADTILAAAGPGAAWRDLRPAALALPDGDAALVAYARAMVWWHTRHRFCGVCGAATRAEEAGHVRACPACAARHFPRTDPAVIVLITHRPPGAGPDDEACLLGSAPAWPAGMYSTLAGFVEPGESLEDTVRREMQEEAGVAIEAAAYASSQPWPFPQSLMLGFRARARDRALTLDPAELRDARWFTRAGLDAALDAREVSLPPPLSISRRLIEDWRREGGPG